MTHCIESSRIVAGHSSSSISSEIEMSSMNSPSIIHADALDSASQPSSASSGIRQFCMSVRDFFVWIFEQIVECFTGEDAQIRATRLSVESAFTALIQRAPALAFEVQESPNFPWSYVLAQIANEPDRYLTRDAAGDHLLGLSARASPSVNGFSAADRRAFLQDQLLTVRINHPVATTPIFRFTSYGDEGLLQTLFYVSRLIGFKYPQIELELVGVDEADIRTLKVIISKLAAESGVKVQVKHSTHVQVYLDPPDEMRPHLVTAIGSAGLSPVMIEDFQTQLVEGGRLLLGTDETTAIYDRDGILRSV